jgi:mono/diheme cytochrome c family protein
MWKETFDRPRAITLAATIMAMAVLLTVRQSTAAESAGTPLAPAALATRGLSWMPAFRNTAYPNVSASKDPAVISEGEYLFRGPGQCTACHVPRAKLVGATAAELREVPPSGGEEWNLGELGVIRSANITSDPKAGVGAWTDREIARAIKWAVDRDGHAILFMNGLGYVDDRDLIAIVSYMRTLPPVSERPPSTEITSEGIHALTTDMIGWLRPRVLRPVEYRPHGEVSAKRGAYLANGPARCVNCHSTLSDSPEITVQGAPFSGGGWADPDPDNPAMEIHAPNLTPSKKFGVMAQWDQGTFVGRFKAGRVIKNSEMPWENFRQMDDSDLISLYLYLRSLPPVDHEAGPSYRPKGWKPAGQE